MKYTQVLKHFRILTTQFPLFKPHVAFSQQRGPGRGSEVHSVLAGDGWWRADDSGGHTRGSASSCCHDVDQTGKRPGNSCVLVYCSTCLSARTQSHKCTHEKRTHTGTHTDPTSMIVILRTSIRGLQLIIIFVINQYVYFLSLNDSSFNLWNVRKTWRMLIRKSQSPRRWLEIACFVKPTA